MQRIGDVMLSQHWMLRFLQLRSNPELGVGAEQPFRREFVEDPLRGGVQTG